MTVSLASSFHATLSDHNMKTGSVDVDNEPKGHICPPSDAKHPKDRWESLFVYGFICRFTTLRGKVEGLDSPVEYVHQYTAEYFRYLTC